jgi:hypothetical protein
MAELVYILCGITSFLCAALLLRSYIRTRTRLLLWTSLGFAGLALSNILLYADLVMFPDVYLMPWRTGAALLGVGFFLYGLIWDTL